MNDVPVIRTRFTSVRAAPRSNPVIPGGLDRWLYYGAAAYDPITDVIRTTGNDYYQSGAAYSPDLYRRANMLLEFALTGSQRPSVFSISLLNEAENRRMSPYNPFNFPTGGFSGLDGVAIQLITQGGTGGIRVAPPNMPPATSGDGFFYDWLPPDYMYYSVGPVLIGQQYAVRVSLISNVLSLFLNEREYFTVSIAPAKLSSKVAVGFGSSSVPNPGINMGANYITNVSIQAA